jgi:3-hydroxybutyryl-CoA dehydrogenase
MTARPIVGIVGSGTMGAGIAQVASTAGAEVILFDVRRELADKAKERIASALRKLAQTGKLEVATAETALASITPTERLADLGPAELVIEAVPEKLDLKRALFADLGRLCARDAILATNTSSLSVGAIASAAAAPERVAGMHFFNPAAMLPLVEVVQAASSADATVDRLLATARAWGKTPIRVRDTPGFVVNRVARPFYLEAFRMLEEDLAPIESIDGALELAGFRMGPGRLLDLIGLDVNWDVSCSVYESFDKAARFEPNPIQKRMIDEGRLGRKSGRGFYVYGDTPARPGASPEIDPVLAETIVLRTVGCIVNEAARALGDGIASADDIDVAMKLGTNYPKGPLAWGRELGPERIVAMLRGMGTRHPERYAVAPRLLEGSLQ